MTYLRHIWAFPVTLLGLAAILVCGPLGFTWRGGVLFVACKRIPTLGSYVGLTLGHVVFIRKGFSTAITSPLVRHELAHVSQCERWGPGILVAYPLASLWSRVAHGNWYTDNYFERAARAHVEATRGK